MKLLISRSGRIYAAGPRKIQTVNTAEILRRIKKECQRWKQYS